jgi:catechol 2,3-dioxygenase-like lactoylglutathione lyase family enzyme
MTRTTTRITSVSLQVTDQDRALAFYTETLGCQLRADVELWPGARWVEVVPPGSDVSIALLTADGGLPIGVRLGTEDADAAHAVLTSAGATVNQDVLRLDFAPPMFTFQDPDENLLVLIEDEVEQ